jgi:hypothetical protein
MLQIKKQTFSSLFSTQPVGSGVPALSPVSGEDDELIHEIEVQSVVNDDAWTLTATPNADNLERYWNRVENDIRSDPEWFEFAED